MKEIIRKGGDPMAKHEFGIMATLPEKGKRYDNYEPCRYNCISVDDYYLENIISEFNHIDFYYHTTGLKGKGLEYCGITLIPPSSLSAFSDVIRDKKGLSELFNLTDKAIKEDKWMIHFGI